MTQMNRNLETQLNAYIKQQKGEIKAVAEMVQKLKIERQALAVPSAPT